MGDVVLMPELEKFAIMVTVFDTVFETLDDIDEAEYLCAMAAYIGERSPNPTFLEVAHEVINRAYAIPTKGQDT